MSVMQPPTLDYDFTDEIAKCKQRLAQKKDEERQLRVRAAALLSNNADIGRQLSRVVHRTRNRLTLIESDASQLRTQLMHASEQAEKVSSKVRKLDNAKQRVVECLQRCEDLNDLHGCRQGVQEAMMEEDYQTAARHIQRFLQLDAALFRHADEEGKVATSPSSSEGHSLLESYAVLKAAQEKLKEQFTKDIDAAIEANDRPNAERYFKLFPMLNEHEIGLNKFGAYLNSQLKAAADKNFTYLVSGKHDANRKGVAFADTATLLFEGIARMLDAQHAIVLQYYGQQYMVPTVEILQIECDTQFLRIVDAFVAHRHFSDLVKRTKQLLRAGKGNELLTKLDSIDLDELDALLTEITLMQMRFAMYCRFVTRKVIEPPHDVSGEDDEETKKRRQAQNEDRARRQRKLNELLQNCATNRRMQELMGDYVALEEFYMQQCVRKILQMYAKQLTPAAATGMRKRERLQRSTRSAADVGAMAPEGGDEERTPQTLVDDVLYVLRKCVRRAITSDADDCVCAVMNNAATTLDTTLTDMLAARLKAPTTFVDSYASAALAVARGGEMGKSSETENAFIFALNTARAAHHGIHTLKATLIEDCKRMTKRIEVLQTDKGAKSGVGVTLSSKIEFALSVVDETNRRLRQLCTQGVEHLCAGAARPKIANACDPYTDYTHAPDEEQFADMEVNEPFVEGLLSSLDALLAHYESVLLRDNYEEFVAAVATETSRQIEKQIYKCTYNRLGGMQFDREFRALSQYLTGIGGWMVRERLSRLHAIVSLLNVASTSEAAEIYAHLAGGEGEIMTRKEVRRLLRLRIDLSVDKLLLENM